MGTSLEPSGCASPGGGAWHRSRRALSPVASVRAAQLRRTKRDRRGARGSLPDLVEVERSGFVTATRLFDGRHTVEQMAPAAESSGPVPDHHGSLSRAPMRAASASTGSAQGRRSPECRSGHDQLLRGTESTFSRTVSISDADLEQLDVVIASIHRRHDECRRDDARIARAWSIRASRSGAMPRRLSNPVAVECHVEENPRRRRALRARSEILWDPACASTWSATGCGGAPRGSASVISTRFTSVTSSELAIRRGHGPETVRAEVLILAPSASRASSCPRLHARERSIAFLPLATFFPVRPSATRDSRAPCPRGCVTMSGRVRHVLAPSAHVRLLSPFDSSEGEPR